jgi:hypothetical protein
MLRLSKGCAILYLLGPNRGPERLGVWPAASGIAAMASMCVGYDLHW